MHTMSKAVRIGLTGSIASGKSTALLCFKNHGFHVFSADEAVSKLYKSNDFISLVALYFPNLIVDGMIDRTILVDALKDQEFHDHYIEFVHNEVLGMMLAFLQDYLHKPCVCEVPLLYEAGWQHYFDEVWCIGVNDEISHSRALSRGMSDETYQFLKKHQWSIEEKKKYSDVFVENNTSQAEFYEKLTHLIKERLT